MDESAILKRYGYFFNSLMLIGSLPLSETPKIEKIRFQRGHIQAAYKQIKEEGLAKDYTLINYLCLISAKFVELSAARHGMDLPVYVELYYDSNKEDCNNLFRLIFNHPYRFAAENSKEVFLKMINLWYQKINLQ